MKKENFFIALSGLMLCIINLAEAVGLNFSPELYPRREMSDGRRYLNVPVKSTDLFGNSTELMYYYATLYVGDFDNLQEQALIIDTGSGIMSFPCEGYCTHCGKHINKYYPLNKSKTARILDCNVDQGCTCLNGTYCKFGQAYGEGSSYHGFWVEEQFYFGSPPNKQSNFTYEFGCVTNETNLFYTQEADGILGLSSTGRARIKPIFDVLKDEGVTQKREFALCLGSDGG